MLVEKKEELEREEKEFRIGGLMWTQTIFKKIRLTLEDRSKILIATLGSWDPDLCLEKTQEVLGYVHQREAKVRSTGSSSGSKFAEKKPFRKFAKRKVAGKKVFVAVENPEPNETVYLASEDFGRAEVPDDDDDGDEAPEEASSSSGTAIGIFANFSESQIDQKAEDILEEAEEFEAFLNIPNFQNLIESEQSQ